MTGPLSTYLQNTYVNIVEANIPANCPIERSAKDLNYHHTGGVMFENIVGNVRVCKNITIGGAELS